MAKESDMPRHLMNVLALILALLVTSDALAVYNADLGKWISRDAIGYADGSSLQQYCRSNPIVATDYLGLVSPCQQLGLCPALLGSAPGEPVTVYPTPPPCDGTSCYTQTGPPFMCD